MGGGERNGAGVLKAFHHNGRVEMGIWNCDLLLNGAEHLAFCSTDCMLSARRADSFKWVLTSTVVFFGTEFLLALWPTSENMLSMKFQEVFVLKTNSNIKLGGVGVLLFRSLMFGLIGVFLLLFRNLQ